MSEGDDGFLNRWSRRKSEATGAEHADPADGSGSEEAASDVAPVDEAEIVANLPDIESLDESSDFSVFLQRGVPDALRRQALRKLWRVNPVFSVLDGMNEYDEDYSIATTIAEGVKTVYQVGKGMVSDDELPADAEDGAIGAAPDAPGDEDGGKVAQDADPKEDAEAAEEPVETASPNDGALDPQASATSEPENSKGSPADESYESRTLSGRTAAERRWGAIRG